MCERSDIGDLELRLVGEGYLSDPRHHEVRFDAGVTQKLQQTYAMDDTGCAGKADHQTPLRL
jgi:hypothetical protein